MEYPRVLIVANNSLSLTNSNGRTLGNFFVGWPKDRLAQFCISIDNPNFDICNNYYCVTDKDALKSFLKLKSVGGGMVSDDIKVEKGGSSEPTKRMLKTPVKTIARNMVWASGFWKNTDYYKWINNFNPDIILLLCGDSIFMLNIAVDIAKKNRKPLCLFNAEGYYFFKQNYMYKGMFDKIVFPLYSFFYRKAFINMMSRVKLCIYANDMLKDDYDKVFDVKSVVLYTGSSLVFHKKENISEIPVFSYLGTLGLGRHKALVEVGEILQSIDKSFYLNVYGNPLTLEMEDELKNAKGIRFKGFVSYEKVKSIIYESDVLFHAESQDEQWLERLKYGFSTKIADTISSGTNFILYSSPDIACADYIRRTGAGWLCCDRDVLKNSIKELINDNVARVLRLKQAEKVAMANHDILVNAETFRRLLCSVIQ